RDLADFFLVWLLGTGGDARGFFQQNGRRRRFGDELERLVLKNGDDNGDDESSVSLGGRVEFLAEAHDVDAVLAERRADRRRGIRLARRDLQLDLSCNLLRHKI